MRIVFQSEDRILNIFLDRLRQDLEQCIQEKEFWKNKVLVGHGVISEPIANAIREVQDPVQVGNHLASWPEMKRRLEKAARKKDEAPSPAEVDNNRKPDGISDREFKMMADKAARELREN